MGEDETHKVFTLPTDNRMPRLQLQAISEGSIQRALQEAASWRIYRRVDGSAGSRQGHISTTDLITPMVPLFSLERSGYRLVDEYAILEFNRCFLNENEQLFCDGRSAQVLYATRCRWEDVGAISRESIETDTFLS